MQSKVIFGLLALFLLVLKSTYELAIPIAIPMSEQQPMMSEQTVLWSDKLQVVI